jgi:hypothetical protein
MLHVMHDNRNILSSFEQISHNLVDDGIWIVSGTSELNSLQGYCDIGQVSKELEKKVDWEFIF